MLKKDFDILISLLQTQTSSEQQIQLFASSLQTALKKTTRTEKNSKQLLQLLLIACGHDNVAAIQILLDKGANPIRYGKYPFQNDDDRDILCTPLYMAAKFGSANAAAILLQRPGVKITNGANDDGGKITPLYIAACAGHATLITQLCSAGADPNAEDDYTPLHIAAERGNIAAVNTLITVGANKDAQADCGSTPLHLAVENDRVDVVRILLEAGANKDVPNNEGNTPLHIAAMAMGSGSKCRQIIELLIQHNANLNIRNKLDKRPADVIIDQDNAKIFAAIVSRLTSETLFPEPLFPEPFPEPLFPLEFAATSTFFQPLRTTSPEYKRLTSSEDEAPAAKKTKADDKKQETPKEKIDDTDDEDKKAPSAT